MFRIFKRKCWQPNDAWPSGYEPYARPMDSCPTYAEVDTRKDAVEICGDRNEHWRAMEFKVSAGVATKAQLKRYYMTYRYEWTET